MTGFFFDLGHPDAVLLRVKAIEPGGMVIELITQDKDKVSGHEFVGQNTSAGLNRWWSRRESNPRPQVFQRQFYIRSRLI